MADWLGLIGALALVILGLRLSAFFSGSETGFYRVSFARLTIESQAGDQAATQILGFARNPAHFLATTLIGNNVANYVTTLGIGMASVAIAQREIPFLEIASTLCGSPVVFLFGELMPKSLYYRAPLTFLRRDAAAFAFFFRAFLPISLPLIGITRLFERWSHSPAQAQALALGRKGLIQVFSEGHQQGLLTEVQRRLVHGLLHAAAEPVTQSMTPRNRILGISDEASARDVLQFAQQYGVSSVAVRRAGTASQYYGYVRAADAAVSHLPLKKLIRTIPRLDAESSKLQALTRLREVGAVYGCIIDDGNLVGIVSEHGLSEQLMRGAGVEGRT